MAAASEGLLDDAKFFWIPSLGGPTSVGGGFSWLFPLKDGAPPIGWSNALAYLSLPAALVVSQYVSQKIITPAPQSDDPAQQNTQAILRFLPLMLGWLSLSVPSGLALYWITNNVITTGIQVYLKQFGGAQVPPKEKLGERQMCSKKINKYIYIYV